MKGNQLSWFSLFPMGSGESLGILPSPTGQEELGHQKHAGVCSLHHLLTHPSLGVPAALSA